MPSNRQQQIARQKRQELQDRRQYNYIKQQLDQDFAAMRNANPNMSAEDIYAQQRSNFGMPSAPATPTPTPPAPATPTTHAPRPSTTAPSYPTTNPAWWRQEKQDQPVQRTIAPDQTREDTYNPNVGKSTFIPAWWQRRPGPAYTGTPAPAAWWPFNPNYQPNPAYGGTYHATVGDRDWWKLPENAPTYNPTRRKK